MRNWFNLLKRKSKRNIKEKDEWQVISHGEAYENNYQENITAVIAGRLAQLTFGESYANLALTGEYEKTLKEFLENLWNKLLNITAQAYGKGGKVILPLLSNGKLTFSVVDQSRVVVTQETFGKPSEALVLADCTQEHGRTYYRLIRYALKEDGLQTITQEVIDETGNTYPLHNVSIWENLDSILTIPNCNRLFMGFIRCPRDKRTEESEYGVPITYGATQEMNELAEHLVWYRREFKLTRVMLGLDSLLIADAKRSVQDSEYPFVAIGQSLLGEKGNRFECFAPQIRQEAFENRLQSLQRRLEKACGLSQGILTERQQISYANKDEVRASMYDTFTIVRAMRTNIQKALEDVLYSAEKLCLFFGETQKELNSEKVNLTEETGVLSINWDMSLLESTQESFNQLLTLTERGWIGREKIVSWVLGCSEQQAIKELQKSKGE